MRRRQLGAVLVAVVGMALTSGCHEDTMVANLHSDDSYIRPPEMLNTGEVVPPKGDPFPVHVGNEWTMQVLGLGHPSTEQIVDMGPRTIAGRQGEVLQVRSEGGKPPRDEVYAVSGSDVALLASGMNNEMMQMSPPLPLFRLPMTPGDTLQWEGVLHLKNMSSGATALSRVTGTTHLMLPSGEFAAYRVDTMITTTIDGQQAAFPMTRWVSPGIGLVQERVLVGQQAAMKQLIRYHVAGKN